MNKLRDQHHRDRFTRELDKNFCVSASAGAGKTTAIVQRIAQLALQNPEALQRLVVVTYTTSAAEELRTRARARVLEQLHASGQLRQNLLAELRRAFFGTIHSFCLKLVRDHGRTLGLPTDIDLLEETDEPEFWARFCESPPLDSLPLPPKLLSETLRFLSFEDLLALARRIDADVAEKIMRDYVDLPQPEVTFELALADDGGRSVANTRANQEQLHAWLRDWNDGAQFLKLPDLRTGSGTFKAAFADELAPLARWLGNASARLAAEIALGYRSFRREERRLTYADQISWCRKLIENPRVLDRLRARELIVILDEAQDTDTRMFSILTELTRPRGAVIDEWPKNHAVGAPEPGRFCFVGDDQQAIFASRTDVRIYRQYVDAFAAGSGGEALEFSVTMRCPQRVIGAVNAVFFTNGRLRQRHLAFRELHAQPKCEDGAAWVLPIEPLPEKANIETLFDAECEQVARFLLDYGPAKLGVHRWSDIAVLCPRHRWLARAVEIFSRAGVPCRLLAQKKIQLEVPQRSWPAALFYVLLNPWDRFELIGVLREIFAVSDVDLANAHAANNPLTFWSYEKLSPRLKAALETLRKLRAEAPIRKRGGTLSRFVEHVLDASRLAARLEAIGEPASQLGALRHSALQAECDGLSLRQWVRRLCDNLYKSAEGLTDIVDEIPILTSQKSKGLEWPVVIPLGLGRAIRDASRDYPRVQQGEEITVHLSPVTVDEDWEEDRELKRREELQRVFYVTLTRAKSLLIVPDSAKLYANSRSSFLDLCRWHELDCESFLQAPAPLKPRGEAGEKKREFKSHAAQPACVKADAVENSRRIRCEILLKGSGSDNRMELPEGGDCSEIGGVDYAVWWHQTMRYFPWLADVSEQEAYLNGALDGVTDGMKMRAEREIQIFAPFRNELREVGKHFLSEVPFSHARSESEWLDGVMDLVVVARNEELWLLAWANEQRSEDENEKAFRERIRQEHSARLAGCAEVLRMRMRREVAKQMIYFTELGVAEAITP